MSDNWVVQHLINTLDTWNEKLRKVYFAYSFFLFPTLFRSSFFTVHNTLIVQYLLFNEFDTCCALMKTAQIKLERINERATLVDDSFYPYQTEVLILKMGSGLR